MGKPEAKIENYFIEQCALHGVLETKFASPGRRGFPDRVAWGNGHTVFIEMKAINGEPSELQKLRVKQINDHGGIALFAYTKEAIDEIMKKYFMKGTKKWEEPTSAKHLTIEPKE